MELGEDLPWFIVSMMKKEVYDERKRKGEEREKGKGRGREKEWRLFEVPERCN